MGHKICIKSNSTVTESTETVGSSWETVSEEWAVNPADSEAWEWADIDALQIGVSIVRGAAGTEAQCTQVYVEVDYTPAPPYTPENKSANMGSKMVAAGLI